MRRWLFRAWLVALLVSNGWRLLTAAPVEPAADQQVVELALRDGAARVPGRARLPYRLYGPADAAGAPILLIHGTPVASSAMDGLARELATGRQVLSPDLPGFGRAAQDLPDYSSVTHGRYLADALETLDVDRVHVVAYSQGGAAALALAEVAPDRIESLTMASAIGLQAYELFGSYRVNHLVYRAQHIGLTALRWLVPHFGYFDDAILGKGYTRNLTDTDQRVLEPMLRGIEAPVLIVHGRDDDLVPLAAARAHHRMIPQSQLEIIGGGHEPVYADPASVARHIAPFLDRVDAGKAAHRADATPARIEAAAGPVPQMRRDALDGAGLFVLLLALVAATYVSEDLTCITAGLLVAEGIVGFAPATLACLIGIFTSDLALFAAGRLLGPAALRHLVSEPRRQRAANWLRARGPAVILASRFLPGTRLPTYTAAGALRMPLRRFAGYFAIATVLWTPLLVGAATWYGDAASRWLEAYAETGVWLLLGGAAALWLAVRFGLPLTTHAGRRRAWGRWQRLTHFEYWPRWAFYPPIVLQGLWLAARHRSLTLFALANPAMPLGGLVGESKSDILAGLASCGRVMPFQRIEPGPLAGRVDTVERFAAEHGWPVVLKPDQGERGRDVAFAADADAARDYLAAHDALVIAQRQAHGQEFGVFYLRQPGDPEGALFSITRKGKTTVTGDGARTLERLILDDDRAVCMVDFFTREHAADLTRVPAHGEVVALNRIGTHSRGSLFTDAGHLASPQLRREIDRISRHYPGFYLGRYDLMADDDDALRAGRDLRIIELNGVSSEATHIYDPALSVWNAWRVALRQWRAAWRIGARLRARGLRPPGAAAVLRALRNAD